MIPYGKHFIDEDDVTAVSNVLRGTHLTQGPSIDAFEDAISDYVGSKYAVAVSSCTAGLHLAALAAGLGPGDTLITSPNTFVASANAGLYVGATIAFADINPLSLNMDPVSLTNTCDTNPQVKVVIPVHFAGLPCDMEEIKSISDIAGAVVIEDAAHALGAEYKNGKRVGSCCYSLMTVFSLHPVKAIAAGEGGVITTNDETIYRKLLRLRSHGINKQDDAFEFLGQAFTENVANPWYYEMQELGFHYRITDIQCALAHSQLTKLDRFIERRREIALTYDQFISGCAQAREAQPAAAAGISAHHLYVIRVNYADLGMSRAVFQCKLKDFGIGTQVHYVPVPMHPHYQRLGHTMDHLPVARAYYKECLSLPIFYSLSLEEQRHVTEALSTLLS